MTVDRHLDLSGLVCPLPVLRTRKALKELQPGAVVEVVATDPASVKDMAAFCEATGHALLASEAVGESFRFLIRRSA